MEFRLSEFEMGRVTQVDKAINFFGNPIVPKSVLKKLTKLLCEHENVFFGHAVFEDRREFWTITYMMKSSKDPKVTVKRTEVMYLNGNMAFKGKREARGTLFSMEGRREFRIVKSIMKS
jgi:hypothetical protein